MDRDGLRKKLHLISFTVRVLMIAFFIFCAVQLSVFYLGGIGDSEAEHEGSGFYGHNYCGTFFISMTRDNSFADRESYINALRSADTPVLQDILLGTAAAATVISLLIFLDRADRQTIHKKSTAWLLLLSGGLYAAGNTFVEIGRLHPDTAGFKGIMASQSYYPQLYAIYGIPLVIFAYGLILLYYEKVSRRKSTAGTERALKCTAWAAGIAAFGFMLWRFIGRCCELFNEADARLPFYSVFLDLPRAEAVSESAYKKVLVFRFIKDVPVIAASTIAVTELIRLMYSAAKGRANTAENRRRLKTAAAALAASSVIFNLLGIAEVNMIRESFTGIYGGAVYTVGIRSGCEPMLYAFLFIIIQIYIQVIPETEKSG